MIVIDRLITLLGYIIICGLTVMPVLYAATRIEDVSTRRLALVIIPFLVALCISVAVVISM